MYLLSRAVPLLAVLFLYATTGCQTASFQGSQATDEHESLLDQIRRHPNRHNGKVFLVGGEIQGLRYLEWKTEIEFSEIPLENEIHPKVGVAAGDRFYVVFPERLDKSLYKKGKVMTVAGREIGMRAVDGKTFPLLEYEEIQVWNRLRQDRFPSFGALMGQF